MWGFDWVEKVYAELRVWLKKVSEMTYFDLALSTALCRSSILLRRPDDLKSLPFKYCQPGSLTLPGILYTYQ